MHKINESEKTYRFGQTGPKYLIEGPRLKAGVVRLEAGEDFKTHYHNIMEENFLVTEGEITFKVDNETVVCGAGDFIHIEPGERHYLKNTGNTPCKAVFMLAPATDNDKYED